MAKTILIAGAPRVGKTTALKTLIAQKPILAASTDAIRYMMRRLVNEQQYPALFAESFIGFDSAENISRMRDDPLGMVKVQNDESEVVWPSCLEFIYSNLEDGHDIALEGVAILPKNVVDLPFKPNILFLVNRSDQTEVVKAYAHNNPDDWLHKYSDEVIEAFCVFNQKQNEYFYNEATGLGMPLIEIDNETFTDDIARSVRILLDNQ